MTESNVANLSSSDSPESLVQQVVEPIAELTPAQSAAQSAAQPSEPVSKFVVNQRTEHLSNLGQPLVQDWRSLTVTEVMNKDAVYALANVTIAELVQQMTAASVPCVVVVERVCVEADSEPESERLHPIGIVTEADLIQSHVRGLDFDQTLAQAVMTTELVMVSCHDRLESAVQLMLQSQQDQAMVTTETGELAGILTQAEILRSLSVAIEQRRNAAMQPTVLSVPLSYRVLVVDDELENRQLLEQWLGDLGADVRTVEGGAAAIAMWQQWQPHLILLDLEMPEVDGYRVLRLIRSHQADWQDQELDQWAADAVMQAEAGLRIIGLVEAGMAIERAPLSGSFVSGSFVSGSFVSCCDDVLPKPLQRGDLIAKLAQFFHTILP